MAHEAHRASASHVSLPWRRSLPYHFDGSIGELDRLVLAFLYSGIAASAGGEVEEVTADNLIDDDETLFAASLIANDDGSSGVSLITNDDASSGVNLIDNDDT